MLVGKLSSFSIDWHRYSCNSFQLTVAVGNLIVILIVAIKMPYQALEFGIFAALMFIDMLIFLFIGYRYKPISLEEVEKTI